MGIDNDGLEPVEGSAVLTHTLWDGGARRAEISRQAARVDSASYRILERGEFIGLQITREYLEYLLQAKIVQQTAQNLRFHRNIASNILGCRSFLLIEDALSLLATQIPLLRNGYLVIVNFHLHIYVYVTNTF